jgi:predicted branched-subunit amino acid permease
MLSARSEFLAGMRAELPILLGDLPFGMFYGVLALQAGLSPALALAMSSIVFAGSSQFIGMQLMAQGASGFVIVATTFVVNLRHALYSASVAPFIRHLPMRWKILLSYLLTDEAYAVTISRFTQPDSSSALNKHWYYFGAGTCGRRGRSARRLASSSARLIPESWSLDFTLALTFIALVVPELERSCGRGGGVSAGIMATFSYTWPYKLGLFAAALTGIVVGMLVEQRQPRSLTPSPESAKMFPEDGE